jgi:hypothetical protein
MEALAQVFQFAVAGRCRACNKPTSDGVIAEFRGGSRMLLCFPDFKRQGRVMTETDNTAEDGAEENGRVTATH